jgi:hypothetical protein
MKKSATDPVPVHSLASRKMIVVALAVPAIAAFTVMLLDYREIINVTTFGLPENYLYIGGIVVILLALIPIVAVWRCPGCGTYLGKNTNPKSCSGCGAQFN